MTMYGIQELNDLGILRTLCDYGLLAGVDGLRALNQKYVVTLLVF